MKISELLKNREVTISCELFPPKKGSELKKAHEVVRKMAELKPAFISVTYGASGGISEHTVDLADQVQNVNGITALAHLTCASSGKEKIQQVLGELQEKKIENILALRGDIPEHLDFPLPDQYHYASELIQEIKSFGDFCIGGACYPEGHPEAESIDADLDHLKRKVEAGCEFLTTQMFFDNNILYNFLYRTLKEYPGSCDRGDYASDKCKPDKTDHIPVWNDSATAVPRHCGAVCRSAGSFKTGWDCLRHRSDY